MKLWRWWKILSGKDFNHDKHISLVVLNNLVTESSNKCGEYCLGETFLMIKIFGTILPIDNYELIYLVQLWSVVSWLCSFGAQSVT